MSLEKLDGDYVRCCRKYLQDWVLKYDAQKYQISEEAIEELIVWGGDGLHALQVTFRKVIACAKQENIECIDLKFVKNVMQKENS